jgi:hypothetical protein
MMLRILMLGVVGVGLFAAAVIAEDAPEDAAPPPEVKAFHLFSERSMAWIERTVQHRRGSDPIEWHTWSSVEDLRDGTALVAFRSPGHPDPEQREGEHAIDLKYPPQAMQRWAEEPLTRETVDTGLMRMDCVRETVMKDGERVTRWVSVEYHPLVVREIRMTEDSITARMVLCLRDGHSDPYMLYRIPGRSWVMRSEADGEEASLTRYTVRGVTESGATVEVQHEDPEGELLSGPESRLVRFRDGALRLPDFGEPVVRQTALGLMDCLPVAKADGSTAWYSRQYPTLPVLQEVDGVRTELVEFRNGHDVKMFRDKTGNSYTRRNMRVKAGRIHAATTRLTVSEAGRWFAVSGTWGGFGEIHRAAVPSGFVREEPVFTPAGVIVALVVDCNDGENVARRWYHRGIVVYQENVRPDYFVLAEALDIHWAE